MKLKIPFQVSLLKIKLNILLFQLLTSAGKSYWWTCSPSKLSGVFPIKQDCSRYVNDISKHPLKNELFDES
jgi:hypothetical protein